jgi:hypothetical protein
MSPRQRSDDDAHGTSQRKRGSSWSFIAPVGSTLECNAVDACRVVVEGGARFAVAEA